VTTPVDPENIPAVPSRDLDVTDRLARMREQLSELRQTFFGVARSTDAAGNQTIGAETAGAGWGVAKPRIHVPAYPTVPYLSTPVGGAYTWTLLYSHTWRPESQLFTLHTRYAVLESAVTNTAVGEFELRWNKGTLPGPRDTPTTGGFLFDSWDSGSPGTKGMDGSLVRSKAFALPTTGPYTVLYWDPGFVTVGVWGRIRAATGGVNDAAKVAPLGLYQSGINEG
jgi:hypothetical protein